MTSDKRRLVVGDEAPGVCLPSIEGSMFDTASLGGRRFMLSFYRFASCPFCNLRVHELVKRFAELGDGFTMVAVFDSPLDNLRRHAAKHKAPFPILADETGILYERYGIERSTLGMFKGMLLRAPTLVKAMAKGYVPTSLKGSLITMPADFLIDERGIIQAAHYGKDEGDHLLFDKVRAFSQGEVPGHAPQTRVPNSEALP